MFTYFKPCKKSREEQMKQIMSVDLAVSFMISNYG